jgi:High potential iron-sulfur protein
MPRTLPGGCVDSPPTDILRRAAILGSTRVAFRAAVVAMIFLPWEVRAKAAKSDFFYQDKPKEGKNCASCRLFTLAEAGKGTCAVVEGEISPTGWCLAYSPRG